MQKNSVPSPISTNQISSIQRSLIEQPAVIAYFGSVNYLTNERVLGCIKDHVIHSPQAELTLLVTSPGGSSGIAMSFYDTVRSILKPDLKTIGMGDVDSSGIIIFLSGTKRAVSKHTTLLFHAASRAFDPSKRYTAAELEAMAKEDKLKDAQYADIVAENSRGRLTPNQVRLMMECNTVLSAEDMVRLGLADEVLV